jgi:hypothetical protein
MHKKILFLLAILFTVTTAQANCKSSNDSWFFTASYKNNVIYENLHKLSTPKLMQSYSEAVQFNHFDDFLKDKKCTKLFNDERDRFKKEILKRNFKNLQLKSTTGITDFDYGERSRYGDTIYSFKNKDLVVFNKLRLQILMKMKKEGAFVGRKKKKITNTDFFPYILFDIQYPQYKTNFISMLNKQKIIKDFSKQDINNLFKQLPRQVRGEYVFKVMLRKNWSTNVDKLIKFFNKQHMNIDLTPWVLYIINDDDRMKKDHIKYYTTILKKLIKFTPDINSISKDGTTLLIWAAKKNQYSLVKELIEKGANVKPIDNNGYSALSYAQNNKNTNMAKLIKGGTSGKQTGIDKLLAKKSAKPNYNSFALIIGINKYMNETNVEYADNSAKSFKLLAENVLGVPKENIIYLTNEKATSGQLKSNIELLSQLVEDGSTIYFYYAGHGVPSTNGKTYLLPSDMKADNIELENGLAISNIYKKLASSPAKEVIVFMDSCFSGKDDSGKLLYKGVAPVLRNKKVKIDKRKLAVFSAGSSSDFANQYQDEEQRMFSYFIIKGLLDGKKNSDELANYVKMSVKRKSLRLGLSYKQVPQYDGKKSLQLVQ